MRKLTVIMSITFMVSLASGALAASRFLDDAAVDYKALLTTAPAEDSQTTRDELKQLHDLESARTAEQVDRATKEVHLTPFSFSEVLGPTFNPDDLPVTAKLLKSTNTDASAIGKLAKDLFNRRRPPMVDPTLKPCVPLEATGSYPSGHSTRATVLALVLAEIYPDKRDALLAMGKRIGDDRVIAGMHFPSDVEAGRVLGKAIFEKLMQTDEFKKALEAAESEVHARAK